MHLSYNIPRYPASFRPSNEFWFAFNIRKQIGSNTNCTSIKNTEKGKKDSKLKKKVRKLAKQIQYNPQKLQKTIFIINGVLSLEVNTNVNILHVLEADIKYVSN